MTSRWQPCLDRANSKLTLPYSKTPSRVLFVSQWFASELAHRRPVLLWVTESDIGLSNWHLYYRLRQSYGDYRLLDDAPGHLCLDYESEDMASLLQLSMLNGWDASFVPELDYVSLTFSHHGFIDVFSDNAELVEEIRKVTTDSPPVAK
jgi:hypothetical protein